MARCASRASGLSAPTVTVSVPVTNGSAGCGFQSAGPLCATGTDGSMSWPLTLGVVSPSGVPGGVQTSPSGEGNVHAAAGGTTAPVIVRATSVATTGERQRLPMALWPRIRAGIYPTEIDPSTIVDAPSRRRRDQRSILGLGWPGALAKI